MANVGLQEAEGMTSAMFQKIRDRVKNHGRADEFGTWHLGHWIYRLEDGGMTQVVGNTEVGVTYYHMWDNSIKMLKHHEYA